MNQSLFDELKNLAAENGVPSRVFNSMVRRVLEFQENEGIVLDDEDICEILMLSIQKCENSTSAKMTVDFAIEKVTSSSAYYDEVQDYDYSEENKHI